MCTSHQGAIAKINYNIRKINNKSDLQKYIYKARPRKAEHNIELSFSLKSYYINKHLSFKVFDNLCIALIITEDKRQFLNKKCNCFLITNDIHEKIIIDKLFSIINVNIDIAFKMI